MWLMGGCLAVFVLVRDRQEVEKVLTVALWVAVGVAAYSIVQHFTGIDLAKTLVGKSRTSIRSGLAARRATR